MNYDIHIAGPLVMLFFLGNTVIGVDTILATLMIDLHAYRPATAMAGMNMYKFLCGAGTVAAVLPLIEVIGIGFVRTIIAGVWLLASPGLWLIYIYGHAWRQKLEKEQT